MSFAIRSSRLAATLLSISCVIACGTSCIDDRPAPKVGPIIDRADWVLNEGIDPTPAHRPERVQCTPFSVHEEGRGVEVETEFCNYMLAEQPLLEAVEEGDELVVSMWHDRLTAPEPATAHVAVGIEDQLLWEIEIPIPSDPAVYRVVVPAPLSAPAGAPVTLHLHNHGYNTWVFEDIEFVGESKGNES